MWKKGNGGLVRGSFLAIFVLSWGLAGALSCGERSRADQESPREDGAQKAELLTPTGQELSSTHSETLAGGRGASTAFQDTGDLRLTAQAQDRLAETLIQKLVGTAAPAAAGPIENGLSLRLKGQASDGRSWERVMRLAWPSGSFVLRKIPAGEITVEGTVFVAGTAVLRASTLVRIAASKATELSLRFVQLSP